MRLSCKGYKCRHL